MQFAVAAGTASSGANLRLPPQPYASAVPDGSIVLMRGHRVIVDNSVDAAALARVVAVLERP